MSQPLALPHVGRATSAPANCPPALATALAVLSAHGTLHCFNRGYGPSRAFSNAVSHADMEALGVRRLARLTREKIAAGARGAAHITERGQECLLAGTRRPAR